MERGLEVCESASPLNLDKLRKKSPRPKTGLGVVIECGGKELVELDYGKGISHFSCGIATMVGVA